MSKIYKTTDRIAIKVDDITIKIGPLTFAQKSEVMAMMVKGQKESDYLLLNQAILKSVSYAVKSVEGFKDSNDEDYKLKFDDSNTDCLDESSLNDLANCAYSEKILGICSKLLQGVPADFKIDGVEVVEKK